MAPAELKSAERSERARGMFERAIAHFPPVLLLRCPFCGHRPYPEELRQIAHASDYRQWCDHCGALGPNRESKAEAQRAWNARK